MSEPVIREGRLDEGPVLAAAFRQMWLDNAVPESAIEPDWAERVQRFVDEGRAEDGLRFFVAEVDGAVIGTACGQRFAGLYPAILVPEVRRYGYVWGVWVDAAWRRRGLGRRLTEACVDALRADACTHVLLHAAPSGLRIYEGLGFVPTNELRLTL
ncbi:MAG: GNAT family N-acetyltransferase [Sandaracinaceae bacterium]|nr:GNAT family N-acetyltransferase [Sandaracinaceae bacterium]